MAYSSGNHAQAVALVSKLLNLKATIVMPKDAPASKLAATRGYGAEIVLHDDRPTLFDRLNQELEAFGKKAQAALDEGKLQIELLRLRRRRLRFRPALRRDRRPRHRRRSRPDRGARRPRPGSRPPW